MKLKNPYTNLVLAVPHAVGAPARFDWRRIASVAADVRRRTDWLTDELFATFEPGVRMVRGRVSRLDCDLERLEGEKDRLCNFKNATSLWPADAVARFSNRMLSEWYGYRAEVLAAAAEGLRPLIVDSHSFPEDYAPDVDVCIGFNDDASCPPKDVLDGLASIFKAGGFTVAFNHPFANALAPLDYCGHAVMIEVNKTCYLAPWDGGPKMGARSEPLRTCLQTAYRWLLGRCPDSPVPET